MKLMLTPIAVIAVVAAAAARAAPANAGGSMKQVTTAPMTLRRRTHSVEMGESMDLLVNEPPRKSHKLARRGWLDCFPEGVGKVFSSKTYSDWWNTQMTKLDEHNERTARLAAWRREARKAEREETLRKARNSANFILSLD